MPSRRYLLTALAGTSALVLPAVAIAQTAPVPVPAQAPETDTPADTADIIVTAQKREETLQSVDRKSVV